MGGGGGSLGKKLQTEVYVLCLCLICSSCLKEKKCEHHVSAYENQKRRKTQLLMATQCDLVVMELQDKL